MAVTTNSLSGSEDIMHLGPVHTNLIASVVTKKAPN